MAKDRAHVSFYVDSPEALRAKLDEIARHRRYFSQVGRFVGNPNRSAVISALVDEELARIAAEKSQK